MKNNMFKRISCIALTLALAVGLCTTSAFAAGVSPVAETPVVQSSGVGSLLTSCAGTIQNGDGSISCYLNYGNIGASIMAGTGSTGASGSVRCFVECPDGEVVNLGTISVSGDTTSFHDFGYCGAGTYTFTFEANTTTPFAAYGRIYG